MNIYSPTVAQGQKYASPYYLALRIICANVVKILKVAYAYTYSQREEVGSYDILLP